MTPASITTGASIFHSKRTLSALALFALAALALAPLQLQASSATWNTNSSGSWTTGSNWTGGTAPGATTGTTNTDTATFNSTGTGTTTVTLPTAENIGNITFDMTSGATYNDNYELTSGTLFLTSAGTVQTTSTFAGNANIAVATTLEGTGGETFTSAGTAALGGLNFTSTITGTGTTLTINGTNGFGGGNAGSIFNNELAGVISGSMALSKSGNGSWYLAGANTYSGGTTLNGGEVVLANAAGLGTGTINVTGNTTIRTDAALAAGFVGLLNISNTATLTIDSAGVNEGTWVAALNSGSTTGGLTKIGLGQIDMQGSTAGLYQFTTLSVDGGKVIINPTAATANLVASSTALVLGGGSVDFNGAGSGITSSQTFASTTVNPGGGEIEGNAGVGTDTFGLGAITVNKGGYLALNYNSGLGTYTSTATNDANGAIAGVFSFTSGGTGDFAKNTTSGSLSNITTASYTTGSVASGWTGGNTLYQTSGTAVSGSVSASGVTTIGGLKLNSTGTNSFTIATGSTLALNDGLINSSAGTASYITGGSITAGTTSLNNSLYLVNNNSSNTYQTGLTIGSAITDNTAGAVNVVAYGRTGTLWLTGANTYTGNTYVAGGNYSTSSAATGIVDVAYGGVIGSSSATVYVNGGGQGGANDADSILRVGTGSGTGSQDGDIKGTIQLDNGTLSLDNAATNYTLSASIAGTEGAGYIEMDGSNTTTINFAAGNNLFYALKNASTGTLVLTAASGSVNTFYTMAGGSGIYNWNAASTTDFNSGTYILPALPNSGTNTLGTINVGGATVEFLGGRYFMTDGGTYNQTSGTTEIYGDRFDPGEGSTAGNNITLNVSGGLFDVALNNYNAVIGASTVGSGTSANVTFNQTGGTVQVGVTPNINNTSVIGNNLVIGNANHSNVTATYALSAGTLRIAGTLGGGYGSSPINSITGLNTTSGSTTAGFTGAGSYTDVYVGTTIGGTGLASGTTVSALTLNTSVLSTAATSGNTTITVATPAGLAVGQYVAGNGSIAAGTTITGISGSTITLSNALTGSINTSTTLSFGSITLSQNATATGNTATAYTLQGTSTGNFNWSGGTLTAGAINMDGLSSNDGTNSFTASVTSPLGTLYQGGSSSVLSPGDNYEGTQYSGLTAITGNYQIDAGTVAINIGGTTAATGFHSTASNYDKVTVSGNAVLGTTTSPTLQLGFINNDTNPSSGTYTILTTGVATGSLTGSFATGGTTEFQTGKQTGGYNNGFYVYNNGSGLTGLALGYTASTGTVGGAVALTYTSSTNTYTGASGTNWDAAYAGSWSLFDPGSATSDPGSLAVFGTNGTGTIAVGLSSLRNVQGINFSSSVAGNNYTITASGSGAITFDNTGNVASPNANITDTSATGNSNTIAAPITLNSTLTASAKAGNTLTLSGNISGTGKGISVTGPGTFILSGNNTYTGPTYVQSGAGTLLVNNTSGSGTGTGNIGVASGTTLGGTGTIIPGSGNTVSITGNLSSGIAGTAGSGSSTGTGLTINTTNLHAASAVNFNSGASLSFNLGSGNTASTLNLTNTGSFAGEIAGLSGETFNFTDLTVGNTLSTGLYTLISTDSTNSALFAGLTPGNLTETINGLTAYSADQISIQMNQVGGIYDIQLDIAAVPEPSTWAMLLGGLVLLVVIQRRKNKLTV